MGFHSHSRMTMDRDTKLTVLITSQPPIIMQVTMKPAHIGFPLTLTHDNGPSYKADSLDHITTTHYNASNDEASSYWVSTHTHA